jgi:hypothetical protein
MAEAGSKLMQFERQLSAVVTPALLAHGFVRGKPGREYHRPSPSRADVYHLVSFQVGPATSTQAGQYTVELGVYYPAFARKMGQAVLKPSIRHSHLNVRARLGFLFPRPEDKWWPQRAVEAAQAAQLAEVADQIVSLGLPWFEATDTDANAALYNVGTKPKRAPGAPRSSRGVDVEGK